MGDEPVEVAAWLDIRISHPSHHTMAAVRHTGQLVREGLVVDTYWIGDDMGLVQQQYHGYQGNNPEA